MTRPPCSVRLAYASEVFRPTPRLAIVLVGLSVAAAALIALATRGPREASIAAESVETFALDGHPRALETGNGSLWVSTAEREVLVVDPVSGEVTDSISLPFVPADLAVVDDSVWVGASEGRNIARLDVTTHEVLDDSVHIGAGPQSLVAAGDEVWVSAIGGGFIQAVDADTGALRRKVRKKDSFPSGITFAYGSLWVTDVVDDVVSRINPAAPDQREEIEVGDSPITLTSGSGAVWVANFNDRSLSRVDSGAPETERQILVGAKPSGVAVGGGWVWVTRFSDDSVVPVDPAAGRWTGEIIPVGDQPQAIVVHDGHVWVANQGDATLSRFPFPGQT